MGKPTGRYHFPCRECGKAHTNPSSSSICSPCGALYHANKLAKKHEERIEEKGTTDSYIIAQLRTECGISMNDADTFLKAFRICMESANG
tara:strand:- start:21 stop:290 length:270 start_codon:yes stop_codon:yes gene_type:complete